MTAPDSSVSEWITGLAGKSHPVDSVMSLLASDFFLPVVVSLYLLYLWFGTRDPELRIKNQYGAMCASASLGFGNLGVKLCNMAFDPWPRPFLAADPGLREHASHAARTIFYLPHDPSFPSNLAAFCFGAAVGMLFYRPKAAIPLFIIGILYSSARVFAGVHYPVDILGGAAIGALMACFTYTLMRILWPLPAACFWIARKLYVA